MLCNVKPILVFIYLFGVLRRFQHCTGHITTGSWKGRGNQYMQFVRVLYCKLPTNGKKLPAFPLEAMPGIEPRPHRWEERVLPLCHRGPTNTCKVIKENKRKSWHEYLSNLNVKTPAKKVWKMIKKISGKTVTPQYTIWKIMMVQK